MELRYETWSGLPDTPESLFGERVLAACEAGDVRRVCDLGGGANPVVDLERARAAGVEEYVVTDIDADELEKTPSGYTKVLADASAPWTDGIGSFDLVFSRYVAEHVPDPGAFHRTVFQLLRPGGQAMHYFPTLYEPAFVFNLLVPERLSAKLLHRTQPGREEGGHNQKFPAYYRWCRGATSTQVGHLQGVGFAVEEYLTIFGHGYLTRAPSAQRVLDRGAEWLCRRRAVRFSSYAAVRLRRPDDGDGRSDSRQ